MAETQYTKADVLDVLLDTHRLAMEIFDAVDADSFKIDRVLLAKSKSLCDRLAIMHNSFVFEYATSGAAARDMLAGVQDDLRRERGR